MQGIGRGNIGLPLGRKARPEPALASCKDSGKQLDLR